MFVYFEILKRDTDINISDELRLYKITVSNVWVKNNPITHIYNNPNISKSKKTILWVNLSVPG